MSLEISKIIIDSIIGIKITAGIIGYSLSGFNMITMSMGYKDSLYIYNISIMF